jgi:hypothetical protein
METSPLRQRLTQLNTKAYYLLVALSFLYRPNPALFFKLALSLTAFVAVLPVQDYFFNSERWLTGMRVVKVVLLTAALFCSLLWIWDAKP